VLSFGFSFFTTKDDGSGIGLSLSRPIMRLHGGALTVRSDPDEETVFHTAVLNADVAPLSSAPAPDVDQPK